MFARPLTLLMMVSLMWVMPAGAQARTDGPGAGRAETLYDLMAMPDLLGVMREEGLKLGADMGEEYFPNRVALGFDAVVQRIYDVSAMDEIMREAFVSGLLDLASDQEMTQLIRFFRDGPGPRLVAAELTARRAFLDNTVETEAEARAPEIAGADPELAKLVEAYIAANDLIERNVSGALTANYNFYLGLVDGGGYDVDDRQILSDVWEQEEATREESARWLRGYLFHAYGDVARSDLEAYVDLSQTDAGTLLNQVLFDSFGVLYNDIYRALGLSISSLMTGEEL
tara:strand:- start:38081 stop:38935 length:855 start_codon:yes stop_codon:yes gene_type:complete